MLAHPVKNQFNCTGCFFQIPSKTLSKADRLTIKDHRIILILELMLMTKKCSGVKGKIYKIIIHPRQKYC